MNKWLLLTTLALASLFGPRPEVAPAESLANRLGLPAVQRQAVLDEQLPRAAALDDDSSEQAFQDCTDILR